MECIRDLPTWERGSQQDQQPKQVSTGLHISVGMDTQAVLAASGIEAQPGPTRMGRSAPDYQPRIAVQDDAWIKDSAVMHKCLICTWNGCPRNPRLCPRCGRYGALNAIENKPPTKKGKTIQNEFMAAVGNFFSYIFVTKIDEQPIQQGNSTHDDGNSTHNVLLAPPIDFDPSDYGIKDHQDDEHHTQRESDDDMSTTTIHNDSVTTPQQQPPPQAPHYTAQTNGYDNLSSKYYNINGYDNLSSTYYGSERVRPLKGKKAGAGLLPAPDLGHDPTGESLPPEQPKQEAEGAPDNLRTGQQNPQTLENARNNGKNAAKCWTPMTPVRLQSAVSVAGGLVPWVWSPAIGTSIQLEGIPPPFRGICGQPWGTVVPPPF